MPESYLALSHKEQRQIILALSMNEEIKRDALLLEKDIWICWALEFLFKMPNRLPMAFKGGTSLSKAFRVIDRFSKDVDITIDSARFSGFCFLAVYHHDFQFPNWKLVIWGQ